MSTLTSEQLAAGANQFPGKTVIIRDRAWSIDLQRSHYVVQVAKPTPLTIRVLPNIVLLNPEDGSLFLETNAYGFLGPAIDFSKKIVAIWGDSTVAGWGKGWIDGLSAQFPDYYFLNGGVDGTTIDQIAVLAMESNKRLPIVCNLIFAGWNTLLQSPASARTVYYRLHRLLDALPNPVLCTQPTSLNANVIAEDITPFLAYGNALGFRGGYNFGAGFAYTLANVQALYNNVVEQNEVMRNVVEERRKKVRQHVPVFDFYRHFDTTDAADFRENFVDFSHFRLEAYPLVRRIFCEEFASLLGSLERAA